jgi:hypothetical protein
LTKWEIARLSGKCRISIRFRGDETVYNQRGRPDTRIFSPLTVPRLCDTIGRYWYLFKRLATVAHPHFHRFEHIATNSSGKVVAKSEQHSLFSGFGIESMEKSVQFTRLTLWVSRLSGLNPMVGRYRLASRPCHSS